MKALFKSLPAAWGGFWFAVFLCLGDRKIIGWRRWLKNFRYLLQPWESEYLRWRMLTVLRTPETLDGPTFRRAVWTHRKQFWEWAKWHRKMRRRES
jgi:hypothetical protein